MKKLLQMLALVCLAASAFAQIEVPNPIPNDTVTGTTQNKLVKYNTTASATSVIITATTDTTGAVGICADGCGTSGKASVITLGQANCIFDNTTVANDYVQISSTVAGDCHDAGASKPTSGQIIGRVFGAGGAAGTYAVHLILQDPSSTAGITGPLCSLIGSSDTLSAAGTFATTCSVPSTAISGVGQIIEVRARGTWTTGATASPILNFQVNAGGTSGVCLHSSNNALAINQTENWDLVCYIHIVTTGAPGTADTWGLDETYTTTGGSSQVSKSFAQTGTVSFTTNSTQSISIQETATPVSGESFTLTDLVVRNY